MLETLKFTFRIIKKRPLRSLLTILQVGLGVWIVAVILSLNFGATGRLDAVENAYGNSLAKLSVSRSEEFGGERMMVRTASAFRYEDLALPQYKGKVCLRAGQHPYNTALIAAMIAHDGEAKTEAWLQGVKANLGRKPTGGDRDVARDILGGICEVGLANSYYVGHMKAARKGTDARMWGDAIQVVRPTFAGKNSGTHVNISGAALAKNAPNRDNAVKLMEFLVSAPAQQIYAEADYEYPVRKGVPLAPIVAESIGELTVDPLPVAEIAKYRKQASALVDKVGFDR